MTADLSNTSNHIKLPWDPTTPFEMLIDQIKECIEFANASNLPFTVVQILNTAYNLVFNTGCFFKDSKKWNACPNNEKTWDNFKTHFLQAQNELWLQQQTTQTSGYTSTNATNTQGPTDAFQHYQDTADTLANLATATSADCKAFENLNNTIANLMQQVKDKDTEIAPLKKCINECSNCSHNNNKCDQGSYCWMHAYLFHTYHNSENFPQSSTQTPKGSNKGQPHDW